MFPPIICAYTMGNFKKNEIKIKNEMRLQELTVVSHKHTKDIRKYHSVMSLIHKHGCELYRAKEGYKPTGLAISFTPVNLNGKSALMSY